MPAFENDIDGLRAHYGPAPVRRHHLVLREYHLRRSPHLAVALVYGFTLVMVVCAHSRIHLRYPLWSASACAAKGVEETSRGSCRVSACTGPSSTRTSSTECLLTSNETDGVQDLVQRTAYIVADRVHKSSKSFPLPGIGVYLSTPERGDVLLEMAVSKGDFLVESIAFFASGRQPCRRRRQDRSSVCLSFSCVSDGVLAAVVCHRVPPPFDSGGE